MKELDSNNVQGKGDSYRQQIRHGISLKRELIPFIYRMDKIIQSLQDELQTRNLTQATLDMVKYKFNVIYELKSPKTASAKSLLNHIA